jgi:hypothetical protein
VSAQPIGGHVLAHASTTRLYLKKGTPARDTSAVGCCPLGADAHALCPVAWLPRRAGKAENRLCKVVCSPHMPEAEGVCVRDDSDRCRSALNEFAPADTHLADLRPPALLRRHVQHH